MPPSPPIPSCSEVSDSEIKGIDGIWEGRAPSRPFQMAETERGPPNVSIPFVAESIVVYGELSNHQPLRTNRYPLTTVLFRARQAVMEMPKRLLKSFLA